jgi:MFS family permease
MRAAHDNGRAARFRGDPGRAPHENAPRAGRAARFRGDPGRRPLAGLLAGMLISTVGTAMTAVALPWLVLVQTGSAARTGLIGFAEMTPYVLVQALGGPLVDRLRPRRAAVQGNLVAAAVVGLVPSLYAAGVLRFGVLAAVVALAGAARGLSDCATAPLVPASAVASGVPLERAAGLNSGVSRTGLLLGGPLAGGMIALTGAPAVLIVDAVSFLLAAGLVAVAVAPAAAAVEPLTPRRYVAQLAFGLRHVFRDRLLAGLISMIFVANLIDMALSSVLLPVWAREKAGGAGALGLVLGSVEAGSLAGVALGAWLGPRLPRWKAYAWGFLLGGAPRFAVLAAATTLPPVLVVTALAGAAGGVINPIIGAVIYERTPAELQARVIGTLRATSWAGIPLGALTGAALTNLLGIRGALLAAAAAYAVTTLAPFAFPAWRDLDRRPAATAQPAAAAA